MTYAQSLFTDLADSADSWRQQPGISSVPVMRLAPDELRKLALVRSELLQVGAMISVVTSFANALESNIFVSLRPQSIGSFAPAYSVSLQITLETLSTSANCYTITQHWQALSAQLSFAQQLTRNYLDSIGHLEAMNPYPIEIVADSWRRVCGAGVALHARVADVMADAGYVCDPALEGRTLVLMCAAARGGLPCLDRNGRLTIPGWAERRYERRRDVNVAVDVTVEGTRVAAFLHNATTTGLGLDVALTVVSGAKITVHCPDRRDLVGFVKWSKDGKAGVRLLQPLNADDPLLLRSMMLG